MEIDDSGEVVKIFCKTCREFFSQEKEKNAMLSKVKGSKKFIDQSGAYIDGTAIVKKCNFEKHLTQENHKTAALRLKEASISKSAPAVSTTEEVPSGAVKQTLLRPMIQKISAAQRLQLGRKFQLAHFTCASAQMAICLSRTKISESLKKTIMVYISAMVFYQTRQARK